MQAPPKIQELVENFDRQIEIYKSGRYNEHQVRIDYVNPLFKALGWDINNKNGFAENYRDVRHEYTLRTADGTKSPDYCFCIGGVKKFFLETKKPSVHIKTDISPALQVRRYGWTGKLDLSILTDFEEFAVYDCRVKPKQDDKASVARIEYLKYTDYLEKWDYLQSIFSKNAIQQGSFDKYISSDKAKKGTTTVDQAFLADMENWRDTLARNIALRNSNLSTKELNHLVQATLDRIVFLRICEDRDIEAYGRLQDLMKQKDIYQELTRFFKQADDKYNSGLFHFKDGGGHDDKPDKLSLALKIDDKPLKEIIDRLYYPKSPYVFSQIPAEILGQVYEQFLGKVIRLTPGHQAKVEEKPEVRKAGGVYYTPKYIVDYIVKNTVGELLKNKTPAQAKKLKILDPACGSGSFLIVAYQFLLDWYLDAYSRNPSKHKKRIYEVKDKEYKLTTQEKKNILLNNIYGVDIDRQAVEVTKLSLLLKVLEGENKDTLDSQMQVFHERALPNLSNNIKCGNSLIGTDYFLGSNLDIFEREEMEKINAFDWEDDKSGFGNIMKTGGFNAVIGNPPWGAELGDYKKYLQQNYICKTRDSAAYFIEVFIKNASFLIGLIVPKTISYYSSWSSIREIIKEESSIQKVLDCGICFSEVNLEAVTMILKKSKISKNILHIDTAIPIKKFQSLKKISASGQYPEKLTAIGKIIPTIGLNEKERELIEKLYSVSTKVGDLKCQIFRGLYIPDQEKKNLRKGKYKFINKVPDVKYYYIEKIWEISLEKYERYIKKATKILKPRIFFKVLRGKKVICYPDLEGQFLTTEKLVNFIIDQNEHPFHYHYICGIFNSKLLSYYVQKILFSDSTETSRVLDAIYLNHFILPKLDLSKPSQKAQHDRMVQLVDQMLDTQKQLHNSKSESDLKHYQQKVDILDRQIDMLVYELYELTPEEIKIVEGGA